MQKSREEKKLVKLAIKGDHRALEILLTRYINFCFSIAVTLLEDQKLAEKAIETTFIQVEKSIGDLYDPKGFFVWLYEILKNNIVELKPKGKTVKSSYFDHNMNEFDVNYSTMYAIADEDKPLLNKLINALRSFNDLEKEVFVMVDFEGISCREASVVLGIDELEVRTLLYRVKREMKAIFLENRAGAFKIQSPVIDQNILSPIEYNNQDDSLKTLGFFESEAKDNFDGIN